MSETTKKAGRKTREAKYRQLKELLKKKELQRNMLDEEIKKIKNEIQELEQFFLLKKTESLQAVLTKKGITIEQLTAAVEKGKINLDGDS